MNRLMVSFLFAVVAVSNNYAIAGATGYQCVVVDERHLEDNGTLVPYPKPIEIRKRFAVNRNTGALTETNASFWAPNDAKTTLHATGNKQNNFDVSYVAPANGGGVHSTRLVIRDAR